ncbi:hypothetical protein Vafri_3403 [Volvox africanus]|uniref:CCDC81 HU domain-containing protein n=1 Tax=Volvox africanus TaxID=51714 RepID=A0A8J4ETT9_9CHLO|nr:hypothetical protein Vafri_3403 [Volvox africanus]
MFTEVDLFHDCAVKHSDIAPNQALGEHTYAAVWSALRGWLQALFARCRGAVFPTFARIAWYRVGDQMEDGAPILRPIFVPSDAYLRAHLLHTGPGVMRASTMAAEELNLEPCEEYSAMKIAIKHSCSLNKDVVFCCTRHLLHHLGEALHSGRPVALDLGVGVLSGRDRCLSFRFHSQYLAHWPATAVRLVATASSDRSQRLSPGVSLQSGLQSGSGSTGGSSTGTCGNDRVGMESDGGRGDAWRGSGCAGPTGSTSSSGRGEYFHSNPGNDIQQQGQGLGDGGQQKARQVCRSPGAGENQQDSRKPGRESRPPSARTRPAWGARVPPPRPASPGRLSDAAASHSPMQQYSSTGVVNNGTEAPGSPGVAAGTTSGQMPHERHQLQQQQQQHKSRYYHQHENVLQDVHPNNLKAIASGVSTCHARQLSSDGAVAAVADAMPVGRAVALAVRTPRPRPSSCSPRPQATTPSKHQPSQQHAGTTHSLQAQPNGVRPSSARRCRQPGNGADGTVNPPADNAMRLGNLVSPRMESATAAPRPPWGSGYGARARTSAGGAAGTIRPRSAPRLRPGVAASAPVETVGVKQGIAEVPAGEPRHWSQAAWAAGGVSSGGDSSGGGGSGGGLDVRQLWSPDNNLASAAGVRRGSSVGRARRLQSSAGCSPAAAVGNGGDGSMQPPPAAVAQQHLQARSLTQTLQPHNKSNNQRESCTAELNDHVSSDQQKLPLCLQEQQQQEPPRQFRGTEVRKPLFLSPHKDAARPVADSETAATPAATFRGRHLIKPQQQILPQHRPDNDEQWQAAAVLGVEIPESCEEPDNSPQLRRDQSAKTMGSPEQKRSGTATTSAVTPGTAPGKSIVRTLSPRVEVQQYNLRYGAPGGSGYAAATGSSRYDDCNCRSIPDVAVASFRGPGRTVAATTRTGQVSELAGTLHRDGSRMPSRFHVAKVNSLVASPTMAMEAAAPAWDHDAPLTASNRAAAALGSPASASALQGALGPRNWRLQAEAREGLVKAVATALHGGSESYGPAGGASFGGTAQICRGEHKEDDSSSGGFGGNGSNTSDRHRLNGGSGGGTEGLSNRHCGTHKNEALCRGYPLPPYDSSSTVSEGGEGVTAAAVQEFSSRRSPTPTSATALAITSNVQAVLGRNHIIGAEWIYRSEDTIHTYSSGSSSSSSLMQLVRPKRDQNFTIAPSPQTRPGPLFEVPRVITEADLPEPAWQPVPSRKDLLSSSTGVSGDQASSCMREPSKDGATVEELRGEEAEGGLEAEVVACSAASSSDICWSARSGHGQDSVLGSARGGGGVPARHRRACGGALDASEAAGSRDEGGGIRTLGGELEAVGAAHGGVGISDGCRSGSMYTSRDVDSHPRGGSIAASKGNSDSRIGVTEEVADGDGRATSGPRRDRTFGGNGCYGGHGGGGFSNTSAYPSVIAAPTATTPVPEGKEMCCGAWAVASAGGSKGLTRVAALMSTDSSMPLMGSGCDAGDKEEAVGGEEEDGDDACECSGSLSSADQWRHGMLLPQ